MVPRAGEVAQTHEWMGIFDAQWRKVGAYLDELRERRGCAREFACPSSVTELTEGLPVRVGAGANRGIILRADTFVELGGPDAGCCALVLWTDQPTAVRDGRVRLFGADIQESAGRSLPLGQVLLVGGRELGTGEHQSLEQAQYVADQIEGYMVRSSSRSIWSRVSKEAAAKGFCFESLGRALMALFKAGIPKVEAMEAVFITSGKEDVLRLEEIAREAREIGREIVREDWKAKGFDLDCSLDCRSCEERQACDDIRKVMAARLRKERGTAAARAPNRGEEERC